MEPSTLRLFACIPLICGLMFFLTGLVEAIDKIPDPNSGYGISLVLGAILIVTSLIIFIRSFMRRNGITPKDVAACDDVNRATEMRRSSPPGLG